MKSLFLVVANEPQIWHLRHNSNNSVAIARTHHCSPEAEVTGSSLLCYRCNWCICSKTALTITLCSGLQQGSPGSNSGSRQATPALVGASNASSSLHSPSSKGPLLRGGSGMCTASRLLISAPSARFRGCTMMAVLLRYSFRVNSRKAPSSKTGLVWARTDSRSQGHTSACVQEASWGGRRHSLCPHTSTTVRGPCAMALYRANCSQGVPASAVGPKLVGPACKASLGVIHVSLLAGPGGLRGNGHSLWRQPCERGWRHAC